MSARKKCNNCEHPVRTLGKIRGGGVASFTWSHRPPLQVLFLCDSVLEVSALGPLFSFSLIRRRNDFACHDCIDTNVNVVLIRVLIVFGEDPD